MKKLIICQLVATAIILGAYFFVFLITDDYKDALIATAAVATAAAVLVNLSFRIFFVAVVGGIFSGLLAGCIVGGFGCYLAGIDPVDGIIALTSAITTTNVGIDVIVGIIAVVTSVASTVGVHFKQNANIALDFLEVVIAVIVQSAIISILILASIFLPILEGL